MNNPPRDLMTFQGTTVSGTLSGIVTLNSDYLYATTSGIQPPKGVKMKIWEFRITGQQVTVQVMFTKTSGGTPQVHDAFMSTYVSGNSTPALIIPLERPIVIPSLAGTEFVQIAWNAGILTSNYGPTYIEFDAEFESGMI